MTNDLAKAEALFSGFKEKQKQAEAQARAEAEGAAPPASETPEAPPAKTRRRVRIRDVSAIRPAAAAPSPAEEVVQSTPPDRVFRRQISDTLRQLGRDENARGPSGEAKPAEQETARRASVTPKVINAFQVKISAPSVQPDGELVFVIEGDDIAQVASDALVRVAEYMSDRHPGAAWKMQALERLPLALAPRG